jgi:hypothetical protein
VAALALVESTSGSILNLSSETGTAVVAAVYYVFVVSSSAGLTWTNDFIPAAANDKKREENKNVVGVLRRYQIALTLSLLSFFLSTVVSSFLLSSLLWKEHLS